MGAIPRDESVALAERHLGLMTAGEGGLTVEKRQRLAELIERSVDLDDVLSLAVPLPVPGTAAPSPSLRRAPRARIGIAHDAAFCFYYRDNLALLEAAGAELVSWSPLDDTVLPAVDGLYFGGGYPELYGATLAANRANVNNAFFNMIHLSSRSRRRSRRPSLVLWVNVAIQVPGFGKMPNAGGPPERPR